MKKLLLFAFGAMMAMPLLAQEEDVTNYIQNPGFDEDITWGVNGETKTIVKDDIVYSGGRSQGWMAADSTVYAHSLGTRNRKDGIPSTSAWNGFLGRVQGWTVASGNVTTPEWVYFGTVPYGLGATAIPIADDGDTCLSIPDKPEEDSGDDNKAALYLRAGWGGWATYSQVVNLPCAVHRLDYWVKNANFTASQNNTGVKNLCKVTCRKETFEDNDGFNAQEWTKHSIQFTPTSEFTIQFGFESSGGSGSNPFIWIDGIKLYKVDEADPAQILEADLTSSLGDIQELQEQARELGLEGLINEMNDCIDEIDGAIGLDLAEMEAALKKAEAAIAHFNEAIAAVPELDAMLEKMLKLIETTQYPGIDDLQDAYMKINDLRNMGTADQILGAAAKAEEAIKAYNFSQEATEQNPADYTFLVKSPWFIKASAEPTLQDGVWVYANEYTVGGGQDTNTDLSSDGWYKSGADGGDQRVNFQQGRSCWNAWNNNFTTTIGVAQDLTDLPNGYYTVSADLITQAGYCTNQHTFARSTAGSAISASLTADGWIDGEAGPWETLTTTEKVLVVDGKLTIGAEGTGNGNASAGWFLVTNFRLNYLGAADDNAIKQAVADKLAAADEFAAKMHFAADRKAFQDSIAKAKILRDPYLALTVISAAQDLADKSEAAYEEYMMEGKTLPTVQAQLAGEGYEAATDIVRFAFDYVANWMVCDTATYTDLAPNVELLKNYVNTYAPAYNNAANVAAAAMATGKAYLEGIMAEQKAALTSEMKDAETVNAYVAKLQEAAGLVNKQNIVESDTATDYTPFIVNPNAESMTGWDLEKGTGDANPSKSGQWYDGSSTRYFDSWNGSGLFDYKVSQLVKDLPNGTYTLGVYTRTPAEGAYVFYTATADTTFVEIPLNYYINEETGEEEIASDKFGPIWNAAKAAIEGGMAEDDPAYALQNAIYNANNGQGRGFQHQEFQGIEVKNHQLLIGTMTGTEASATEKVFAGNWYSVGGWTLTLTAKGDNTGWGGPIAEGIETVSAAKKTADGIYTIAGTRMQQLQRGLNIVVSNGKARKVLVK